MNRFRIWIFIDITDAMIIILISLNTYTDPYENKASNIY